MCSFYYLASPTTHWLDQLHLLCGSCSSCMSTYHCIPTLLACSITNTYPPPLVPLVPRCILGSLEASLINSFHSFCHSSSVYTSPDYERNRTVMKAHRDQRLGSKGNSHPKHPSVTSTLYSLSTWFTLIRRQIFSPFQSQDP